MKQAVRKAGTKKQRKQYEKVLAELDAQMKPRLDAIRDMERITDEDLKIIVN